MQYSTKMTQCCKHVTTFRRSFSVGLLFCSRSVMLVYLCVVLQLPQTFSSPQYSAHPSFLQSEEQRESSWFFDSLPCSKLLGSYCFKTLDSYTAGGKSYCRSAVLLDVGAVQLPGLCQSVSVQCSGAARGFAS